MIEVRDIRKSKFLWIDKAAFEFVSRRGGSSCALVYAWLCYFANNKKQDAWPSINTLQEMTGLGRMTVIRSIKKLAEIKAIAIEKKTGEHNVYILLEIQPELFPEPVSKVDQYQNETSIPGGTTTSTISGPPIYELNKLNKINKRKPSAVLKERLKKVHAKGFNISAMIHMFYKEFNIDVQIPDEVLVRVCDVYLANGTGPKTWAYFRGVLRNQYHEWEHSMHKSQAVGQGARGGTSTVTDILSKVFANMDLNKPVIGAGNEH